MKNNVKYLLVLFSCIIFTTGCGIFSNNEEGSNTSTGVNDSIRLSENISNTQHVLTDGNIVVIAKNNNKELVELEIEVELYDESGTYLGKESDYLTAFAPNSEAALIFKLSDLNYDTYKIYFDAKKSNEISYLDQIEIVHNDNGEEIVAQIKNNSNNTIEEINASIVYYQGDKVVGYEYDYDINIQSGRSANLEFSYPYDRNYDNIRFETYKIFVNTAYSYKNY